MTPPLNTNAPGPNRALYFSACAAIFFATSRLSQEPKSFASTQRKGALNRLPTRKRAGESRRKSGVSVSPAALNSASVLNRTPSARSCSPTWRSNCSARSCISFEADLDPISAAIAAGASRARSAGIVSGLSIMALTACSLWPSSSRRRRNTATGGTLNAAEISSGVRPRFRMAAICEDKRSARKAPDRTSRASSMRHMHRRRSTPNGTPYLLSSRADSRTKAARGGSGANERDSRKRERMNVRASATQAFGVQLSRFGQMTAFPSPAPSSAPSLAPSPAPSPPPRTPRMRHPASR
jgi:hypothetical protein